MENIINDIDNLEKLITDKEGLISFCRRKDVLSLYIFGSQITGNSDKFSDLNLGVVFYLEKMDRYYL